MSNAGMEMETAASSGPHFESLFLRDGLSAGKRLAWRSRSLRTLLKMGHCAPAVMKALLDICGFEGGWPVKMAAGLPGGIGDTGYECGGITSPLLLLGWHSGQGDMRNGLPLAFYKGHGLFRRFVDRNGTALCRNIRGDNFQLAHCIRAVCCSPEITASVVPHDGESSLTDEERDAYALLYSHLTARGFHCAHQVLRRLSPVISLSPEILDATSPFLGGTLFKGLTCSAYAAGVMTLGWRLERIEDSLPRVMRMIVLMKTGGDAFADHINAFNRIMNSGNALARWFAGAFGDTRCRILTGCDFSIPAEVKRYIETDGPARCQEIAEKVAERVLPFFESKG